MKMLFTSRQELKSFLQKQSDWKKWLASLKKCGDRVFCGDNMLVAEPMTESDIEELMA